MYILISIHWCDADQYVSVWRGCLGIAAGELTTSSSWLRHFLYLRTPTWLLSAMINGYWATIIFHRSKTVVHMRKMTTGNILWTWSLKTYIKPIFIEQVSLSHSISHFPSPLPASTLVWNESFLSFFKNYCLILFEVNNIDKQIKNNQQSKNRGMYIQLGRGF